MGARGRFGQVVLVLLGLLSAVIAVSVWFAPEGDRFERDACVLISTFGAGVGLLVAVLAVVGLPRGERSAWLGLWVLPAFFVAHVALLGTWLPDAVFLLLAVVALLVTRPGGDPRATAARPTVEAAQRG